MDLLPGKIIDLPANLKRQFYPPLMLLEALSGADVLERRSHGDTTSAGDEYNPRQIFQNFVNRLALICQVEPNGDAVSSCAVLQEPDKVVYLFASNHRSTSQLTVVARALRSLLEMVPQLDEESDDDNSGIRDRMLQEVLALSWCRVTRYLKCFITELSHCIANCEQTQPDRCM